MIPYGTNLKDKTKQIKPNYKICISRLVRNINCGNFHGLYFETPELFDKPLAQTQKR